MVKNRLMSYHIEIERERVEASIWLQESTLHSRVTRHLDPW